MVDIYQPLPLGEWIRVLEVHEAGSDLVCNFKTVCLNDYDIEYSAVSYAWEDTTPTSSISFPDGRSLPLTRTLTALFHSLRQGHSTFTVWIDALCMNQADPVEKAHQVSLMGKVYARAKQVLVWLGKRHSRARTAFQFMRVMGEHSDTADDTLEELLGDSSRSNPLTDVISLLRCRWFHRVWVIQEITVNRNVIVACGLDQVPLDNFSDSVAAIWKYFDTSTLGNGPRLRGLWNVTRVIEIRDKFLSKGPVPYEDLLETAYHVNGTDMRDMVFAFWGIGDHERPIPAPNYSISVEEVYIQTAEALLCHGTSLDALVLAGLSVHKQETTLPTWVFDLRKHSYNEPFVSCDHAEWNAGGPIQLQPVHKPTTGQLHLEVAFLGEVDVDCPMFQSYSIPDQEAAMRSILSLRHRMAGDVSEEEWLEYLWPSLVLEINLDDKPVGLEYREYFNEWLSWLLSSSRRDDLVHIKHNRYYRAMSPRVDDWKAFMTKEDTFCIGPPDVKVGDLLCIVPGCRVPLILRPSQPPQQPRGDHRDGTTHSLVSWCYAHGIMKGEARNSKQCMTGIILE